MDIRVLRYFLAVAREENITRAAESLHIAQPSLSKQMMELEAELGKKLLVRGKKKVTLTEEGVLLRHRADELVALLDKTEREIRSDVAEIGGEIAIGGNPLPVILETAARLRQKYPAVRFQFYSGDATDVTERLDHGSLDFAILLEPVDPVSHEFLSLPDTAEWGLMIKRDSELAQYPAITRELLSRTPLILHRRAGLQREIFHWAGTNLEQNIAATYNVVHGNPAGFVKSGLGAFLTTSDLLSGESDSGSVCFRPLDPPLKIRYALAWKQYPVFGKAAEAFLEEIRRHCE